MERFASDLMVLVGRYHDESSVDANYRKAARMLHEANAEVEWLRVEIDLRGELDRLHDSTRRDV